MRMEWLNDNEDLDDNHEESCVVPPPVFDPADYVEAWAEEGIAPEALEQHLRVLWDIAKTFVLMGFNADISQIISDLAAQSSGAESEEMLRLEHATTFNDRADAGLDEAAIGCTIESEET